MPTKPIRILIFWKLQSRKAETIIRPGKQLLCVIQLNLSSVSRIICVSREMGFYSVNLVHDAGIP